MVCYECNSFDAELKRDIEGLVSVRTGWTSGPGAGFAARYTQRGEGYKLRRKVFPEFSFSPEEMRGLYDMKGDRDGMILKAAEVYNGLMRDGTEAYVSMHANLGREDLSDHEMEIERRLSVDVRVARRCIRDTFHRKGTDDRYLVAPGTTLYFPIGNEAKASPMRRASGGSETAQDRFRGNIERPILFENYQLLKDEVSIVLHHRPAPDPKHFAWDSLKPIRALEMWHTCASHFDVPNDKMDDAFFGLKDGPWSKTHGRILQEHGPQIRNSAKSGLYWDLPHTWQCFLCHRGKYELVRRDRSGVPMLGTITTSDPSRRDVPTTLCEECNNRHRRVLKDLNAGMECWRESFAFHRDPGPESRYPNLIPGFTFTRDELLSIYATKAARPVELHEEARRIYSDFLRSLGEDLAFFLSKQPQSYLKNVDDEIAGRLGVATEFFRYYQRYSTEESRSRLELGVDYVFNARNLRYRTASDDRQVNAISFIRDYVRSVVNDVASSSLDLVEFTESISRKRIDLMIFIEEEQGDVSVAYECATITVPSSLVDVSQDDFLVDDESFEKISHAPREQWLRLSDVISA
jgi:hypothetical protein